MSFSESLSLSNNSSVLSSINGSHTTSGSVSDSQSIYGSKLSSRNNSLSIGISMSNSTSESSSVVTSEASSMNLSSISTSLSVLTSMNKFSSQSSSTSQMLYKSLSGSVRSSVTIGKLAVRRDLTSFSNDETRVINTNRDTNDFMNALNGLIHVVGTGSLAGLASVNGNTIIPSFVGMAVQQLISNDNSQIQNGEVNNTMVASSQTNINSNNDQNSANGYPSDRNNRHKNSSNNVKQFNKNHNSNQKHQSKYSNSTLSLLVFSLAGFGILGFFLFFAYEKRNKRS
ncbi:hypothetical protein M3M39_06565 [Fructilactobacillus hinvesii]|uniref:LPXTG cell wall anchor domain-containing protein n=1 Tax=Fructilactobacillus hinvesii TaxID=2940300 RepID=A0ABY5BRM1_9LACO|nr:hypothetical protein [Fructilactobacillus hinvesii]USS87760.1 hypothetical protein M3M39_06565 [Fructilactobacillus hinvesii]